MKNKQIRKSKRPRTGVTVKGVRERLKCIDGEFTIEDLRQAMNKRKVFGSYSKSAASRTISKGMKCNMVEMIKQGNKRQGENNIYKKTD